MLNSTLELRALRRELGVMGYNPLPLSQRKLDNVKLTGQLSVMVLLCCFVHYVVSRVLRRNGLNAPCSCPAWCRKHAADTSMNERNRAERFEKLKTALRSYLIELDRRNTRVTESSGDESPSGYSSPVEDLADLEMDSDEDLEDVKDGKESDEDLKEREESKEREDLKEREESKEREDLKEREESKEREDLKDRELVEALQRERETVAALYSELEEERNFSATAASEAMAMISRLQEEKAAVQMEARQFERMVLEKAMYDQEAIDALNELLINREQERIALEEEIRVCKEKLDALVKEERRQSLLPEAKADEGGVSSKLLSSISVEDGKLDLTFRAERDEQSKFVDKFSTTSSQLLSALVQEGGRVMDAQLVRRLSNGLRKKVAEAEETDGWKFEFPEKVDTAPEVSGKEEAKFVDELLPALAQDGGRGTETQPGRRLSFGSKKKEVKSVQTANGTPELSEKIIAAPKVGKEEQVKHVDKVSTIKNHLHSAPVQDGSRGKEAQSGARTSIRMKKTGGNLELKDGEKPEAHKKVIAAPRIEQDEQSKGLTKNTQPPITSVQDRLRRMEAQSGVRAPTAINRKGGKLEEKDGAKSEAPGFVSLRRKWGSQEITLKTLEKTKEERRIEEKKRLSVLDYVKKFEQQQQHGVRDPVQIDSVTNHPETPGDSGSKMRSDDVDDRTASFPTGDDEPTSSGFTGDESSQGRSSEEVDCGEQEVVNALSSVEEVVDGFSSSSLVEEVGDRAIALSSVEEVQGRSITSSSEGELQDEERPSNGNESRASELDRGTEDAQEWAKEPVFVHDVYEVQKSPYRITLHVTGDAEAQQPATPSDRLGKPDLQTFERDEARDYLSMIHPSRLHEEVGDAEKESQQWASLGSLKNRTLRASKSLGSREMFRLGVQAEGLQELTHRLKVIEADRYFLRKTNEALRRENEELKQLHGLSQQSVETKPQQ